MARRKANPLSPEEQLGGVFPGLARGGIMTPPGSTYPTSTPGTKKPGQKPNPVVPPVTVVDKPKKPGAKKPGDKTPMTYDEVIKQQKAEANKAKHKSANKSIHMAEELRSQAVALRAMLGLPTGGGGGLFHTGNGGKGDGITNTPGGGGIHGNVNWVGGTGWKPDGSGPKRPGPGGGVRTGTDVMPGLGGPKYGPGGGQGGGAGQGPRHGTQPARSVTTATGRSTVAGRNAGVEGQRPGDNTSKDPRKPGQGGKKNGGGQQQTGGWGSDDWKKHYPGGGPGGGGGGGDGKDKDKKGRGDRNLRRDGLSEELRQNLKNVELAQKEADQELMKGYNARYGSLAQGVVSNEKAAAASSFANLSNRGRERANAMSEAIMQGAGESDTLRAQGASLRNWASNQGEVNRGFFDTLDSSNASLTDLTTDTRTARVNNALDAQADKNQYWSNYFDAKSDAWTQLGNTYGQMAQNYGDANEQVGSKKSRKRRSRLERKEAHAFMMAAKTGTDSHKQQPLKTDLTDWKGRDKFKGEMNNNVLGGASDSAPQAMARPEGANLRTWNS